ncbi:MAG: energy transducer TonB, partial [Thiobacillus sp.]|nr:energy transducer TonB [Thiobacillus sp.]
MSAAFEEPTLPSFSPRVQRMLVAGWISLGIHAALIALVEVAPPATRFPGELVIEARLVSTQAAPPTVSQPLPLPAVATPDVPPAESPLLRPSEAADALPVARPEVAPPASAQSIPTPPAQATPPAQTQPPTDSASAPQPAPAAAPPPPAGLTSAVDLTNYSAREVDVHPRALD